MNKFIDKEYVVLSKPLTRAEAIRGMDDEGYIEGVVGVSLASIIDSDFENFLDLISDKLICDPRCCVLSDIAYQIVGCGSPDEVLLMVSGHADGLADDIDDIPDNIEIELPKKFSFESRHNSLAQGIVYHAERVDEHGDYCVSWDWNADKKRGVSEFTANDEYYTEKEVKHFISSGQWAKKESV